MKRIAKLICNRPFTVIVLNSNAIYIRTAVRYEYGLTVGSCCALIQVHRSIIQLVKSEESREQKYEHSGDKISIDGSIICLAVAADFFGEHKGAKKFAIDSKMVSTVPIFFIFAGYSIWLLLFAH